MITWLLGIFEGLTRTQRVAVPAYSYPSVGSSFWTDLDAAAQANPGMIGVINVNSGKGYPLGYQGDPQKGYPFGDPHDKAEPYYAAQTKASQDHALTVLGYVATNWMNKNVDEIRDQIDKYYRWYGEDGVDGIFLDEAATDIAKVDDYKRLYNHIKTKGWNRRGDGEAIVVLNPGGLTPEDYISASDIIVTFEDPYARYTGYAEDPWVHKYSPNRFWHIVYAAKSVEDLKMAIALSKRRNAGYVYVTAQDTGTAEPLYSRLASENDSYSYWHDELRMARPGFSFAELSELVHHFAVLPNALGL
jgi:hypothetical protein